MEFKKSKKIKEKEKERDLGGPESRGEALLPDSDGFVAAARGEDEWDTVVAGGRVPIQAPNPIGVTFQSLNFLQFQPLHRQFLTETANLTSCCCASFFATLLLLSMLFSHSARMSSRVFPTRTSRARRK